MRILKILLIIFSLFIIGSIIYVVFFELNRDSSFSIRTPITVYLYLGFAAIAALFNIIYHIKSIRFYRKKEKRQLDKKLAKFFWISTLCFSVFLVYIAGATIYSMIRFSEFGYSEKDLFLVVVFLIPGLFGFVEVSLLRKRIKKLKSERDMENEINDIGNSTI